MSASQLTLTIDHEKIQAVQDSLTALEKAMLKVGKAWDALPHPLRRIIGSREITLHLSISSAIGHDSFHINQYEDEDGARAIASMMRLAAAQEKETVADGTYGISAAQVRARIEQLQQQYLEDLKRIVPERVEREGIEVQAIEKAVKDILETQIPIIRTRINIR
jgi:hypothetical protein